MQELFRKGSLAQNVGYKILQRQKHSLVRKLFKDENKSLVALIARNEATGDGVNTVHLSTFYVPVQLVLLSASEGLGDGNVADAPQSAVLPEKHQQLMAFIMRSKMKRAFQRKTHH